MSPRRKTSGRYWRLRGHSLAILSHLSRVCSNHMRVDCHEQILAICHRLGTVIQTHSHPSWETSVAAAFKKGTKRVHPIGQKVTSLYCCIVTCSSRGEVTRRICHHAICYLSKDPRQYERHPRPNGESISQHDLLLSPTVVHAGNPATPSYSGFAHYELEP